MEESKLEPLLVDQAEAEGPSIEDGASPVTSSDYWREKYNRWTNERYILPRKYKLRTEADARKYSQWAVNLTITMSAVNTKMLNPNFAIMCTPGASSDSFPDTEPFGFNSATYFLPMCTLIGVALSSIFIGGLSDKLGRKILLLVLGWVSAAGSVIKYFTRNTFWGFCASNIVFGFFLGNLPVGMAYVGDVEKVKKRKDELLGILVGCFVLGNSGGGIIAVLMGELGLFAPLWVGSGLMVVANYFVHRYMIEPGSGELAEADTTEKLAVKEDEDVDVRPLTIDKKTLWNIIGGALLDNVGSTGLFPLCLSPLALETFYSTPSPPIMSIEAYQWLSVCVALLVIPSTQVTPWAFNNIGVAQTCVFGNSCTAVLTGLLLWIGSMPPTNTTFGIFVAVMYGGFPFTVLSQLTTGPMLDAIAPEDQIGFIQGLNNSSMNFGMALAPWAFGLLADAVGTTAAISTGIVFSIVAALANSPLCWHPSMGKPKPKPPQAQRKLPEEDDELFRQIVDGEVVDAEMAFRLNQHRFLEGKPSIVPRVKTYDEDKDHLEIITAGAHAGFEFRLDLFDRVLAGLDKDGHGDVENLVFDKSEIIDMMNTAQGQDEELAENSSEELGKWFGQYLHANGYSPHTTSVLMKQMFMASFPPLLRESELTEANIEEYLLKQRSLLLRYVDKTEDKDGHSLTKTLAANSWGIHGAGGWW
mmetsp:Transcript_16021/g.36967  ORF Transcript_16021/g.36967 Transcript_16021/m.36967 type:complete len:699 (-) Transcript_16021:138-2234(-)